MPTPYTPGRPAAAADAALRSALKAEDDARKCAVLWFADILDRRLYRELGYSSMPQYARRALGFSDTRTGDFMRLARKLDALPALRAALPEIGYTKAREIVTVASPRTEARWVAEARGSSRRELATKVKRARRRASGRARRPAAALFDADAPTPAEEVPVRVAVTFTPEQHARWEALLERLARHGMAGDRAELLLEALACRLEEASSSDDASCEKTAPRGAVRGQGPGHGPVPVPVQVHVHECPACGRREAGGRALGAADAARVACDARIDRPGGRNTATIPPRVRRRVLARDRHRCRAPGCGRRRFLEVHHVTPRRRGGSNEPDNLITLCGACHRLWHERARE